MVNLIQRCRGIIVFIVIPLLFFLLHIHVFTKDVVGPHSFKQAQSLSVAKNFAEEDLNILNPKVNEYRDGTRLRRLGFPILQWTTGLFYKIFGEQVIIFRAIAFLIGLLSILGFFYLAREVSKSVVFGVLACWTFTFSPLFFYYSFTPIPDNLALASGIWGMVGYYWWNRYQRISWFYGASLLLALSALIKLPYIAFCIPIFVMEIQKIIKAKERKFYLKNFLLGIVLVMAPILAWYAWVIPNWHGSGMAGVHFKEFPDFEAFLGIVYHYIISGLPELIINYLSVPFFLFGFYMFFKKRVYKNTYTLPLIIWGVGLLTFFFADIDIIGTVHDYYLLPFLPPIFLIVAYGVKKLIILKRPLIKWVFAGFLVLLPLTAFVRNIDRFNENNPGFNPDFLKYKRELRNAAPDSALSVAGNDYSHNIFLYYIDKKGWGFNDNNLTSQKLKEYRQKGAKYLYSDTRKIDQVPEIQEQIDSLIGKFGSIRVYRLKDSLK